MIEKITKDNVKKGDKIDTKIGIAKVIEVKNESIKVSLDNDIITAVFNIEEFFSDLIL